MVFQCVSFKSSKYLRHTKLSHKQWNTKKCVNSAVREREREREKRKKKEGEKKREKEISR